MKQETQLWVKATCCSERWGRHGQHTGDAETLRSKRSQEGHWQTLIPEEAGQVTQVRRVG